MTVKAAICLSHISQSLGALLGQGFIIKSPNPISFGAVRKVHARLSSQTEQILQRQNRGVRHGSKHRTNEIPMNLGALSVQIFETETPFRRDLLGCTCRARAGDAVEPTHRRVVIMRSGVNGNIVVIVMRQVDIFLVAAERELKDTHARKAEVVAQLLDIGGNHPQIFGDDSKFAQRFSNRTEKLPAGDLDPSATFGRLITAGNLPASRETTKM